MGGSNGRMGGTVGDNDWSMESWYDSCKQKTFDAVVIWNRSIAVCFVFQTPELCLLFVFPGDPSALKIYRILERITAMTSLVMNEFRETFWASGGVQGFAKTVHH